MIVLLCRVHGELCCWDNQLCFQVLAGTNYNKPSLLDFFAVHCIDFMFEDIGSISLITKIIKSGIQVVCFIYNHFSTLSLLRCYINKKV